MLSFYLNRVIRSWISRSYRVLCVLGGASFSFITYKSSPRFCCVYCHFAVVNPQQNTNIIEKSVRVHTQQNTYLCVWCAKYRSFLVDHHYRE